MIESVAESRLISITANKVILHRQTCAKQISLFITWNLNIYSIACCIRV